LELGQQSLYFKSPQQLLDIFGELEENNLALIQNCQETEETLEELRSKIIETTSKMFNFVMQGKGNCEFESTNRVSERGNIQGRRKGQSFRRACKVMCTHTRMFTNGGVSGDSQEKMLNDLNSKVKEVYKRCLGDNDGNLSTLQMLTALENRLEQLFEAIELMPPEKVIEAEKVCNVSEI
jgi:uncharacterized protein YpbB